MRSRPSTSFRVVATLTLDIPEEVFASIRSKCAMEWPEDYSMRQYCEKQQFDSYRELERGS